MEKYYAKLTMLVSDNKRSKGDWTPNILKLP